MTLPFHPLINKWFTETYGKPTLVQEEAWPLIAEGKNVLAIAPTGSGKTLTGFLSAISRFTTGTVGRRFESNEANHTDKEAFPENKLEVFPPGKLTVLYISPLKALNEDIRRNLKVPLDSIKAYFEKAGEKFPSITIQTRSGDTNQAERRRFLSSPPSILATTPESLAILLLNRRAEEHLSHVKCLILDEIHTCLGNRRGAYLSSQIDQLALVAGEFQRIALSATVNPPQAAAEFTGGLRAVNPGDPRPVHEKRKVYIVAPLIEKKITFKVEFPSAMDEEIRQSIIQSKIEEGKDRDDFGERYDAFTAFALERIRKNRSTLIFTDSRRRAERICYLINQTAGTTLAFSHHGSLSKDLRRAAEKALAEGSIPCVVATSSLELGIDIGNMDEVILAGSPGSSSSALQRIGRSGHGVGEESRGILFPFHGLDLIASAAIAGAVEERELEESRSLDNPLDVLAQTILSLCVREDRYEDELYAMLRGFYIFKALPREAFDSVVRMLTGSYGESYINEKRLRELPRRLYRDSETGLLTAASGTRTILYTSGGVIANRGYFSMRLAGSGGDGSSYAASSGDRGSKIGELDEEFVWERRIGDTFNFGGRSWRINAIGPEAVEVFPLTKDAGFSPFWKADPIGRGRVLSRRILELMEDFYLRENNGRETGSSEAAGTVGNKRNSCDGRELLSNIKNLSGETVDALYNFLKAQMEIQRTVPLPGPSCIPIEIINDIASGAEASLIVVHSFRGLGINYPLSLCLMGDLEDQFDIRVETTVDNNAIMLRLPKSMQHNAEKAIRESIARLGKGKNLERCLSDVLASSGVFNAAFRESSEASLILPRSPFGKRVPLWITRQKSKRLFDSVSKLKNFPVITEALRSCMQVYFDMEAFRNLIRDIVDGTVNLEFFNTRHPSPFSRSMVWQETGSLLYEYDERKGFRQNFVKSSFSSNSSLSDLAIAESLIPGAAKPSLDIEMTEDFCARLKREKEGWTPEDSLSLCEWVKERVAIPDDEWEALKKNLPDNLIQELESDFSLGGRLHIIRLGKDSSDRSADQSLDLIVHRDWVKVLEAAGNEVRSGDMQSGETLSGESQSNDFRERALPQWFRCQGPVSISRIKSLFALSTEEAERTLSALIETEDIVFGVRMGESEEELYCDRENLELLFRLGRKKRREGIKERPGKFLLPFLAHRQGLVNYANSVSLSNSVREILETLAGYAAPAKLWETEILPARFPAYRGDHLESEIRDGNLIWYGAGKERIAFSTPEDLDLFLSENKDQDHKAEKDSSEKSASIEDTFSRLIRSGFFDIPRSYWQLKEALENEGKKAGILNTAEITEALWKTVWSSSLSADTWEPVHRSIREGFKAVNLTEEIPEPITINPFGRTTRLPRSIRERWKAGTPVKGNWFSLAGGTDEIQNPIEEDELNRARVRTIIKRYGIFCRPLLEHEGKNLSWSHLLPAARRMELAGELIAGRFLSGINTLQFASPSFAREMERAEAEQEIFWFNALDPISPCGNPGLASLYEKGSLKLPARLQGNRLCFRGAELIAVSTRNGKELQIDTALNKEFLGKDLPAGLINFITSPRYRAVNPENKIVIEKINGVTASSSDFAEKLKDQGFVNDREKLVLW